MSKKSIKDIEDFCNASPSFVGESEFYPACNEYFSKHSQAYIDDYSAGKLDLKVTLSRLIGKKVLDLVCGLGLDRADCEKFPSFGLV